MVSDPGELPDRCGIVFATKGPQLAGCVATVAGGLARAGRSARWVAGLQNGVIKDGTLAAGFGTERVLRTTSTLNARAESPLRVDVTGFGHTYVGATGAGRLLLDPAQRALAGALPLSSIIPAPPIRLATCGPAAGAIGATYLPGMISKSPTGVSA